jgi:hypothetical protein
VIAGTGSIDATVRQADRCITTYLSMNEGVCVDIAIYLHINRWGFKILGSSIINVDFPDKGFSDDDRLAENFAESAKLRAAPLLRLQYGTWREGNGRPYLSQCSQVMTS